MTRAQFRMLVERTLLAIDEMPDEMWDAAYVKVRLTDPLSRETVVVGVEGPSDAADE